MKWSEIPDAVKLAMAIVTVAAGAAGYAFSTFQTVEAFQQYQQQHGEQLTLFRVQQIEDQIAQYRYQLLSVALTDSQRKWIEDEIKRLEEKIKCIRKGEC